MKKLLTILIIVVAIAGIIIIPNLSEEFVNAKTLRKIEFTKTVTSSQDPGIGHESHQFALILSPNEGTIYDGSVTYTASAPIELAVLHEISKEDAKGQPTWSVDGNKIYGLSLIDQKSNSGSLEFTGAALALHSPSQTFSATVSVDGWVRGEPTEIIQQTIEVKTGDNSVTLSRANVPAVIPLHAGMYEGNELYYIITDSNNEELAKSISTKQEWKVEFAPILSNSPKESLSEIYVFKNGLGGKGIDGYQAEVFSDTPSQKNEYSALRSVTEVSWKTGQKPQVLESVKDILQAKEDGKIQLEKTELILNTPQIKWPDGQMKVSENKTISDEMEYGESQITDINLDEMSVTFIAHRGWGPQGQTIYYIVTDATPSGPAEMMGVVDSPSSANLISSAAAVDLFQFKNGIKSTGPIGFQPGIASAAPGDKNYSPMWRIYTVEWVEPSEATLLQTKSDIDALESKGEILVDIARPLNSDHIVNCPFIDPFQ